MQQIIHLQRQQRLEQSNAARAACELQRQEHEDLARAYGKIIEVLERDRFQARGRRVKRI
jgi:hypothetical protein